MAQTSDNPLIYYGTPGPMTNPGPYAHRFDDLPTDIAGVVDLVQGVMVHIFWAERYGLSLSDARKDEVQLRWVDRQLARILELSDAPITTPRPNAQKLVGNCRDFTVLTTAILRHQGVPARARCGFGTYFRPGYYEDHWVCEYWNAARQRWILVDAQIDALMQDALDLDFDPLDVPHDRFINGAKAWQRCRSGEADPQTFGIFDMRGMGFVRGDLIRDFMAFNKVEILPWDGGWGYLAAETEEAAAYPLMDRVAALIMDWDIEQAAPDVFPKLRAHYETDPGFNTWPEQLRRA